LTEQNHSDKILSTWKYIDTKETMQDPTLPTHVTQFTEIIRHFIRLKSRLRTVLPDDEEVVGIMARLMETHPQGKAASMADFDLLYNICVVFSQRQEPITMGELSQALGVPLSTATRIVDWLVKNGNVERLPDPEDRRIVRVTLTETGRAMYQAGNESIRKRAELLLRPFTADERENLVLLLNKLVQGLENESC
jgi:DNA-binding MarR family transcriptional regulator